ncbi:hypothetical protein JW960_18095 [candidate division KSB1 bacterium]|nr:hypothetical protein [candidate division KSB1 bacterium]
MKTGILIYSVCVMLLLPEIGWAQQKTANELETNIVQHEKVLHTLILKRDDQQQQLQKLTRQIADFNQAADLSYMQRSRLERLMKQSQQLAAMLTETEREITSIQQQLDKQRRSLITLYDTEIHDILKTLDQKSIPSKEKRDVIGQLVDVKNKREMLQSQLALPVSQERAPHKLDATELNDVNQVKQHIDWLRDRDEQLRTEAYELEHIVDNLQEEVEIRDKMSDLEHDMQLFDHSDEVVSQVRSSSSTKSNIGSEFYNNPENDHNRGRDDISNNAYLEPANASRSSLLRLYPDLFSSTDYSYLNTNDIDRIIAEIKIRQQKMISTADSLRIRSEDLEKHINQLRKSHLDD